MNILRNTFVLLSVIFGILVSANNNVHAATEAGTTIVNQATLSYRDSTTGETVQLLSNTSRIVVAQLRRFSLVASQSANHRPGDRVAFVHRLLNTGNVTDSYLIGSTNAGEDNGDLADLVIYRDLNSNGLVDAAEPVLAESIELLSGQSADFIVSGRILTEQASDSHIRVLVSASSADETVPVQTNTDTVNILPEPKIALELTNSPGCEAVLYEGQSITYNVKATNYSNTLPVESSYLIDGAYKKGVMLSIEIDEHLTLDKQSILEDLNFRTTAVIQIGSEESEWMRLEHWDEQITVSRLGFLLPAHAFEENEKTIVDYTVTTNVESESETAQAQVTLDHDDDGKSDSFSETVCNQITSPAAAISAEIRFIQPTLELQRSLVAPAIQTDSDFDDAPVYRLKNSTDSYKLSRDGVYLELSANLVPSQILSFHEPGKFVLVRLRSTSQNDESAQSRDRIRVLLRETNPGSNKYRSLRPIWLSPDLRSDNSFCPGDNTAVSPGIADYENAFDVCVLNAAPNDTLIVDFDELSTGELLTDTAVIDPTSRVFDSVTLQGVENARVSILTNGSVVENPITGEPVVLITDVGGQFTIPRLNTSTSMYLQVEPPDEYLFPSQVAPSQFTEYKVSNESYGIRGFNGNSDGTFQVRYSEVPPSIDIPLDPANRNSLLQISKQSNSKVISLGDTVQYQIAIRNESDTKLTNAQIIDTPPFGYRYIPGSSRYDGDPIEDPQRLSGETTTVDSGTVGLFYDLGNLESGISKEITYRLQATPGALNSTGINTAVANATAPSGIVISTVPSSTKVSVEKNGVFSDKAIIFGKIYVDSSCDNIHNNKEWPIAGVRLYLQNGTWAITDEDGQYSLYGLEPGLNVIKVDSTTMPPGLVLKPLDTRHGADPDSRFVNLTSGEFHRADFATYCPQSQHEVVFDLLKKRNRELRGEWMLEEASKFNPDFAKRSKPNNSQDTNDGDISHGSLGHRDHEHSDYAQKNSAPIDADERTLGTDPSRSATDKGDAQTIGDPKELVKTISQDQAKRGSWIWPTSEMANDGRFMAVIRSGLEPELFVNDKPVPTSQIGERILNRREKAQIVAWYGVELLPGLNTVEIRGKDPFGNTRVLASGKFKRSGAAVRIHLRTKSDVLPADDGRSMLPVDIVINDINGYPANGVYFVTLKLSHGSFLEEDLQPEEPGFQVRVENGRGLIHLRSSRTTGKLRIEAQTGSIESETSIVLVPAARPLIVAGLLSLGGEYQKSGHSLDDEINDFDTETKARAALFLKGRIKHDLNLTLSLDTDKSKSTKLLRDLNPDEYYPLYGDSSIRGYEAQSRSKLYAKLEKDRHSLMWGDYVTDTLSHKHDLAKYQRTLTGLNGVFDSAKTRIQVFAAEQEQAREVEELRGNGTAMLFQLTGAPIVANSEIIELITRRRDSTGTVINTDTLVRYSDYNIDPVSGNIRFAYTIPSVDSDLNPVFVRVSYDREGNLSKHLVAGLRLEQHIGEHSQLGFSLTRDENPLASYTMAGMTFRTLLTKDTALSVSTAAQKHDEQNTSADAHKIVLDHHWKGRRNNVTKLSWTQADADFNNSTAGIASGKREWRLEHRQQVSNTLRIIAEASDSQTMGTEYRSSRASLIFDKSYRDWSLTAGMKRIENNSDLGEIEFETFLVGVEKSFRYNKTRNGSFGFDYERAFSDANRYRFGLNARVQLHDHVDLYGKYEREQQLLTSSLQSAPSQEKANTWLTLGLESDVLPATKLYSEYRIRGGFSGENIERASGIRGRYLLQPGLTVSPAFEYINATDNGTDSDSLAFSLGLTDTRNPNRKFTAQTEIRDTESSIYYGMRATLAQKLNLDWTGLVREEFTRQTPDQDELTSKHRFTLGLARRPKLENRHHTLFLAHWNVDYGPIDGMDRTSYLFSTHHNRQINSNLTISGRMAAKWQTVHFDDGDLNTQLYLSDIRATWHWRRRWEFDFRTGWLRTDSSALPSGDDQYSFGAGASWLVRRNLRLGVAYNFLGFREKELDRQSWNAKGIRFGLEMKFDEDWFRWLEK